MPKVKEIHENNTEEPSLTVRCGYHFINECVKTNADTLTLTINGVKREGIDYGDWEIKVKKIKPKKK